MANPEHTEEREARELFTSVTGTALVHADVNGGVDYRSPDGSVAVEVTTVTAEDAKAGRRASTHMFTNKLDDIGLRSCWKVDVDGRRARFKGLPLRVAPHLMTLDATGAGGFDRHGSSRLGNTDHGIIDAVAALRAAGVDAARPVPWLCPDASGHRHRVMWAINETGSASDSDTALQRIEAELRPREDNVEKLSGSQSSETHLFVWIDDDSPFSVSRPLRSAPGTPDAHFGLPTRAPEVAEAIQQLWIVHRVSRRGWHWDGATWKQVDATPIPIRDTTHP